MKKLISLFMAVVMLFGIGAEAFAAYEGDKVHAYESADCTIVYNITNEWSGNQQVSVSITNNSKETLRNWAIKFDNTGTISNIWNASVLENDGELCVIRNNGYNYEIIPGATVEFGFMQQGENLSLPENISLCSKTADSTASAEISYEIQNNWGEGFIAAVTIKNISNEPLEAWKLSFNGNFEISSIWNANLLYTEDNSFKVENDITTTPIAAGGTKTFSFEGAIASGEEPVMSGFTLTSIVIDVNADSDDSGETGESGGSGETGESNESGETGESSETGESGESGETGETQEPTDPDKPIESEKPVILCFGEYLADENALEVYWYSTAQGAVSVYENTNDNGWVKLADVTDEDFYKFEITEDFLVKYIKVKQETESGTIESEPFIVAYTEDGYVCTWLDTDEDGLPDFVEEMYGTDPENPDTDSDGLSDYDEIYTVGTSPLKYDTDEDGTNDAVGDLDSDGLTNSQELELGTSPSSADTDGDTLSDYAELYETSTDPLKADTDGDTLSDSDDIALGLDPNDPETFGVPDAEYKVEQTISADSEVMERINTDEAPYELSLEITASGNVGANLIAGNSIYSTITESDARLGGAVSLSYYGGEVEKVKLIYEVGEDYISNDGSEYAANCVDLQGIMRYNIFRYFEDVNMLLPVATEFDVENNTLYAETDELGTYCVLDMEVLLQNFGVAPDGTQMETVMAEYYSAAEVSEASVLAVSDETTEATDSSDTSDSAEKYYVTFVFDIRDGRINEGQLDNLKAEVREFSETVYAEGRDIVIRLMTQDSSDFDGESYALIGECDNIEKLDEAMDSVEVSEKQGVLGNYCVITDALGYVVEHSDSDNSNYVFTIYDQVDTMFEQNIADALMLSAAENGVDVSVITPAFEELTGFQKFIADDSHGVVIDSFSDFADDVYVHIFNTEMPKDDDPDDNEEEDDQKEDVSFDSFGAILITGYEWVELNGPLNSENKIDTDFTECGEGDDDFHINDHLTDWQEVGVDYWIGKGLITYDTDGNIKLPTIQECMDFTKLSYVEDGLARFQEDTTYRYGEAICTMRVMPILSDPTRADSDGDNINDRLDPHKLIGTDIYTPCIDDNGKYGVENHLLKFHTNSDGIRSYYCQNCDYEVVAPEEEDIDNLYYDDYLIIVALEKMHTLVLNNGDLINANIIYSSIDRIRKIRAIHKYSYCDSNGDYVSPLNICIDESNDYYIHINSYETTDLNRRLELAEKVFIYGGKIVIDYLCLTPGFPPALAIAWTVVSELGMALYEQREYDVTSVAISSFFTCVGGGFTDSLYGFNIPDPLHPGKPLGDDILSGTFLVFSLINQYGIANTYDHALEFKEDTRQFAMSVSIQNTVAEAYLGLNLDNNEITKHTFRYYERDENLPYSNALSVSVDSDIIRDYDFITYIVGDKYYTYR